MVEQTLVIIKPDAVERGLVGKIIDRIENLGLRIADTKMHCFTPEECQLFYAATRSRAPQIYMAVENHMTQAPSILLIIKGDEAIKRVFALRGPTNLLEAPEGTIRRDFITNEQRELFKQGHVQNLMHAPATEQEAFNQIHMFF